MIKVYKLLRQEDNDMGTLHPLFIDNCRCLPMNQWIEARAPSDEVMRDVPTGFALIDLIRQGIVEMQAKRPTREQVKRCQLRFCRWVERRDNGHLYDLGISSDGQVTPFAHRPGWHTCREPILPGVNMEGKVWAECLIPADDCEVVHRNINGMTAESQPVEWLISQKLMIVKILPNATQST